MLGGYVLYSTRSYLTIVDALHPIFCLVSSLGLKDHDVGGEDEPKGGGVFRLFVLNILDAGERVATLDLYLHSEQKERRNMSLIFSLRAWGRG